MIHFKNHSQEGFSLIEAVIAIAVMGIILVGVFSVQQVVFKKDVMSTDRLSRILLLKNVLYDPTVMREEHDQEIQKEQRIKEPPTNVKLVMGKMKGETLKSFKYIERIVARATWEGIVKKEEEELLYLRFKAPKKKDRQASASAKSTDKQDDREKS